MIDRVKITLPRIAFVLVPIIVLLRVFKAIDTAETLEIAALTTLVLITMWYAKQTKVMAEEMREQRLMASRPIVIQKPSFSSLTNDDAISQEVMRSGYFVYFEIYNAGNGSAIELTVATLTEEKDSYLGAKRIAYMRTGDTLRAFHPSELERMADSKTYYLVSEYQGILSRIGKESWYQTWLPFKVDKASKEGEVYVVAGELEFKEVAEKDRIDNIISWSKPK